MVPLSKLAWALLGVAAVQFVVLLALNVVLFVAEKDGSSAVVIAAPFVLCISIDAVLRQNSIQLASVVLTNLWILVYTVIGLVELLVYNRSSPEIYARLYGEISFVTPAIQVGVVLVAQIALTWISIRLFQVWRWWSIWAEGDEKLRIRAARAFQIYISLLCLTFFYIVYGCVAPFIDLRVRATGITPFLSLLAYLPVAIVLIVEVLALRFEKKWLMWVLVGFGVVACAFVVGIVLVGDFAIGQISTLRLDCRGSVASTRNRTLCSSPVPIQWSNVVFLNAVVPIYFARFILALVCWHWMGRGIHKPVQVAAARDMEQVAAPTTTPTPLENPQPGSTRPNSGVYQGLPLSEIEEERRQPVASGSAL